MNIAASCHGEAGAAIGLVGFVLGVIAMGIMFTITGGFGRGKKE